MACSAGLLYWAVLSAMLAGLTAVRDGALMSRQLPRAAQGGGLNGSAQHWLEVYAQES